jgi:hypothetical protein
MFLQPQKCPAFAMMAVTTKQHQHGHFLWESVSAPLGSSCLCRFLTSLLLLLLVVRLGPGWW